MTEHGSISCPFKGHEDHKKTLLFVNKEHLSVHCKVHGWLDIEFRKNGEIVDLSDCVVTIKPKKKRRHIQNQNVPVISVG